MDLVLATGITLSLLAAAELACAASLRRRARKAAAWARAEQRAALLEQINECRAKLIYLIERSQREIQKIERERSGDG